VLKTCARLRPAKSNATSFLEFFLRALTQDKGRGEGCLEYQCYVCFFSQTLSKNVSKGTVSAGVGSYTRARFFRAKTSSLRSSIRTLASMLGAWAMTQSDINRLHQPAEAVERENHAGTRDLICPEAKLLPDSHLLAQHIAG
jgi:hypothetical protein